MRTGRNSAAKAGCSNAIVAHWDMRTGRNWNFEIIREHMIVAHWDMRTGRNNMYTAGRTHIIVAHWDMRTGRNTRPTNQPWPALRSPPSARSVDCSSLGYAHWPELRLEV